MIMLAVILHTEPNITIIIRLQLFVLLQPTLLIQVQGQNLLSLQIIFAKEQEQWLPQPLAQVIPGWV